MFVCGEVAVGSLWLPDGSDMGRPCPRCGRTAAFALAASPVYLTSNAEQRTVVLTCMGARMPLW